MNPSDADSALATLRQLKEMLDAGALTPQEFDALKQKLLFGLETAAPITEPPLSVTLGQPSAAAEATAYLPAVPAIPAEIDLPVASTTPEGTDWTTVAAPVLPENTLPDPLIEAAEERRNPLTLVFLIGGALVLLALLLYLTLGGNTPNEHLTSTSQTAADSASTTPEIGPQAEQLTLPPATPETIRVAPVIVQAPVTNPVATQVRVDSAVAPPAASVPVATPAAAPVKPIAKPVPTKTVVADTAI
ncbi:SHOCT domain-containing protein [Hymenobacter bucti]|uniref:SHOCT domain-containing protein n=1 Tax=Hymenobacter bucti TaxID=1844114 RepID=A0ABW4QP86_9BACT